MAFNLFPYGNFHKLNLDWVIKTVKEAAATLEQATETLGQYDTRLSALETSVGVLNQSIQNLSSTVQEQGQAIADLPQIRTQASNAAILAANAEQAAQAADETASTALTQAQSAVSQVQAVANNKLDVVEPKAVNYLRVTDPDNVGGGAFLTLKNGGDLSENYNLVHLTAVGNKVLGLQASFRDGSTIYAGNAIVRGVADPVLAYDAAPKSYVDGQKINVTGSSVSINPGNNHTFTCGELTQLEIDDPPSTGAYSIIFTSGATPTTTVIPATILGLETFVAAANTIYEINVLDNRAVVGSWEVASA